ncbi:FAD/NAD-P-binding domain-containing protein [Polyporus arcularius HHB13444]|uniref:FAD/NAD-P-binding domain-containing protein n=1 Tax=Polyporus arcularius HHB13444 TaxID=1314778 RepID=A0A5C3PCZ8_9APHY|nr:FAD/NAD-P-binding domain-containing protein [Polyporus arcularius HHB13444]
MSAESSRSNLPLQTSFPISFLIIGGGIAGLACALALRRVGHHVLVLEKMDRNAARAEGGVRLPPNLSKILFHWGLRDALLSKASVTTRLLFMRYESGDFLGEHVWDADMLKETRGMFLMMSHAELYDILYDAAVKHGAQVRFGAEVVDIDPEEQEVELASGEILSADVLVGADGEYGSSRTALLGERDVGTPTGLAVYDTLVPAKHIPEYAQKLSEKNGQFVAFGKGQAVVAYAIHGTDDVAFQLYGPDTGDDGRYGDVPSVDVPQVAQDIAQKLRLLVRGARKAVRISVREHRDLEDWVSDDGRLVLVGEAAHPFPPGTIQGTAMAVEDGAVLAKLFSHLSSERQIASFLYAFQELRQARVRDVRAGEFASIFFMTADGPEAAARDAAMRGKAAQGKNVLEGEGSAEGVWEEYRVVFGYDCEDEADDWWVQWGMLRERANGASEMGASVPSLLDFSAATSQVQITIAAE